jgi:hypothetical protein
LVNYVRQTYFPPASGITDTMVRSHWEIGGGIRAAIGQLVPVGSTILELGSGIGTGKLAKKYTMWSIEHDEKWVGHCEFANYIHAPITTLADGNTQWYDPSVLVNLIPINYDLILVDGPPGKYGRDGFILNFDLFRTDVPILIDDTIRSEEAKLARELAFKLNRPLYVFWNFSIIVPHLLSKSQIATIQREAMRVLEKEDDEYLERYFTWPEPIRKPDRSEWHKMIEKDIDLTEDIENIKSSYSYRIGLFATFPVRIIINFFRRS